MNMNWNNNDTKYIIKKIIIYFLIAFAMFIFSTWKAKADVIGTTINYTLGCTSNSGTVSNSVTSTLNWSSDIQNKGQGYLITTFNVVSKTGNGQSILNGVRFRQRINGIDSYVACDVGNALSYFDSGVEQTLYTAKCPINTNQGITNTAVIYDFYSTYPETCVKPYAYSTFVTDSNEAQQIVNGINGALAQLINQNTINSQITQNAINTGLQNVTSAVQQQTQATQNINDSINNDNVTTSDADDFKNNQAFTDSTGLESVINLPLNMVNSLSNECQPIQIHIPYIETDATIPCMSTIYRSKFNSLYTLVKLVVNGFLVYRILLKVYELVHEAKQPDEDKLEVIEL